MGSPIDMFHTLAVKAGHTGSLVILHVHEQQRITDSPLHPVFWLSCQDSIDKGFCTLSGSRERRMMSQQTSKISLGSPGRREQLLQQHL